MLVEKSAEQAHLQKPQTQTLHLVSVESLLLDKSLLNLVATGNLHASLKSTHCPHFANSFLAHVQASLR